ncbi:MAG: O-antigen polysaccharide polymerase Wzy [bacterium]
MNNTKTINLYIAIVNLFFMFFIFIFSLSNNNLYTASLIAFLSFTIFIFSHFLTKGKVLDIYFIFVVLTYLFHFGQLFLLVFNFDIILPDKFNILRYDSNIIVESTYFALFLTKIIEITGQFYKLFHNNSKIFLNENAISKYSTKRDFGFFSLMLLITIIPYFYVDITQIFLSQQFGYVEAYKFGNAYILSILNNMFLIVFIGFVITHKNKLLGKYILISFIFWNVFKMLMVGNRSLPMAIILMCIFIYYYYFKYSFRRLKVTHLIFILLLLLLLPYIAQIRNVTGSNSIVSNFIFYISYNNPLIYMFSEFGGTLLTLIHTFEFVPESIQYANGLTYLGSTMILLPFSSILFGDFFNQYISIGENMNTFFGGGLGGSYVAELYYNFGYFSLISGIFISLILNKISIKFRENGLSKKPMNVTLFFYLLIPLFIYPRGYFYTFITYFNVYIYVYVIYFFYTKILYIKGN